MEKNILHRRQVAGTKAELMVRSKEDAEAMFMVPLPLSKEVWLGLMKPLSEGTSLKIMVAVLGAAVDPLQGGSLSSSIENIARTGEGVYHSKRDDGDQARCGQGREEGRI